METCPNAAAFTRSSKITNSPTFRADDREVAPRVVLTIRDLDGTVVNRLDGSTSKGMHRTHWNLRHAGIGRGDGPLAVPGTYSVDITKTVDGEMTELVEPTEFDIEPLTFGDTSDRDREAIMTFVRDAQKWPLQCGVRRTLRMQPGNNSKPCAMSFANPVTLILHLKTSFATWKFG